MNIDDPFCSWSISLVGFGGPGNAYEQVHAWIQEPFQTPGFTDASSLAADARPAGQLGGEYAGDVIVNVLI